MPKKHKADIDQVRDAPFSFELKEAGKFEKLLTIDDELTILTDQGVYRFRHADKTDPARQNLEILNTFQCVFPFEEKYTLAQWIFRTAVTLYAEDTGLRKDISVNNVLSKCISIARDFWDIEAQIKHLVEIENIEEKTFNEREIESNTIVLPSAPDYRPAFSGFLTKANHIWRDLHEIIKECFQGGEWKNTFDGFNGYLRQEYGEGDPFFLFSSDSLYQLKSVRNTRNALEHPDEQKSLEFRDYILTEENIIFKPAIKIQHPEITQDFVSVSMFMEKFAENLAYIVEGYLVSACAYNTEKLGLFEYVVLPIEGRDDQHVFERYEWRLLRIDDPIDANGSAN